MLKKLIRPEILEMQEISWGDVPDNNSFRLLWGENQQVLSVYRKALIAEMEKVNFYPSPTKIKLRVKIAQYNKVKPENIIVTNGSDEAIELIAKVFISDQDEVVIPMPSYPCFTSVSKMMGAKIVNVPLDTDFSLDEKKLIKAFTKKTKIIWIANPNNPTGNILITQENLEKIIRKIRCIIVFDECYFELSGITASKFTEKYPNVIILRSFTKGLALAGARLGYIIAQEATAKYINRLQQTNQVFNVNRFAQAAGLAILNKPQLIRNSVQKFANWKESFEKLLKSISLEVIPTKTTFCLVKLRGNITAKELKKKLLQKEIYIKDCSIYVGLGSKYVYLGVPEKRYQRTVINAIRMVILGE